MAAQKGSRSRSNARPARGRGSPPPRHRGLGFLFWLCLFAIVIAVAFAARGPLAAAFALFRGVPAPVPARESPKVTVAPLTDLERAAGNRQAAPAARPAPAPQSPAEKITPATVPLPTVRKARLYFTTVDQSGKIQLKSVIRPIPASDSPLKDTLENLLKGPTSQELNLGLVSMIPTDARLRGVVVRGDTAFVDFNESFRFNAQGIDAMDAQIRQIVYAATEFPSVKKVQIQIEGASVRYLGTEGMRIDAPLGRESFQK